MGSGCIFSPEKGDPPKVTKPPYPALDNPQHVLEAFQIAYQHPDSNEAKVLYDGNYLGTSENLSDNSQNASFTRDDEIAHIAALQRSTTILPGAILLELGAPTTWTRLSSDDPSNPQWAQIQIPAWYLEITDGPSGSGTLYSAHSTNPITFSFAPTSSAPGDTTWKIIRWKETITGNGT